MNKKLLVISASPRKGGNSDTLCDEFIRGAQESGNQAEKIFLRDKKVNYCLGCGACSERGEPCPQKDDAAEIIGKMIGAGIIVMATPVYFYTMDALMKPLIDRTCARYTEITGKDFYFIVTAADTGVSAMQPAVEGFRAFLSCLNGPREKGIIYGTGAWRKGEIKGRPSLKEAYETGKRI